MRRKDLEHLIRAAGAISGSKRIIAGREKDREFCTAVVAAGLVSQATLHARLAATELDDAARQRIARAIAADFSQ